MQYYMPPAVDPFARLKLVVVDISWYPSSLPEVMTTGIDSYLSIVAT